MDPHISAHRIADRVERIQEEWRRARPDLDPSPQGVFGRLARLTDAIDQELDRVFRAYGLTAGEFDVLATLRRAGGACERSPSELAASTMVTAGALTKRVDRLERSGLVRRRRVSSDGRARVVGLTAEGRTLIDAAIEAHLANERTLLEAVPEPDRAELERIMRAWLATLSDEL
ncbi:MarR family transcriptional regulator [Chryseoglobus sp. 28M-23]|uniref:MarR family winged helix-turn-helix transcriptional regulator n=1 Tax=Chryseoglobus sp. 28M-23 TaxID=2772253 RepID=UPI0017462624|nr:MarR family transcriptional regulator [Chryseoglobus sp. 28M-23]QOD94258.1 MarR family transcriptional regulator [Chryseoglobus sp. 28M-23]